MLKEILIGTFSLIVLYYFYRWYSHFKKKEDLSKSSNPLKRQDNNTGIEIEETGVFNLLHGYEQIVTKEWKQFNHSHKLKFYSITIQNTKYILFVDFFTRNSKDEGGHPSQVNCIEYFVFTSNQIRHLFPKVFKFNKKIEISEPSLYSCFLPFGNTIEDIKLCIKNQISQTCQE